MQHNDSSCSTPDKSRRASVLLLPFAAIGGMFATAALKPCTVALVIVSALLLLSGCNQPANENVYEAPVAIPAAKATATPDEFAVARANYAKHCSECHGDEGKGGLVEVENTKLKVPSLTEGHALGHRDQKFVKQITEGTDGMPQFKDKLSPEEIIAMVRFIRREFQGK